jgi:hypothetical protein
VLEKGSCVESKKKKKERGKRLDDVPPSPTTPPFHLA